MGYRHSHSEREPFAQIPKYDKMLIRSNFSSQGAESEVHFRTACRSIPILLLILLPTTGVLCLSTPWARGSNLVHNGCQHVLLFGNPNFCRGCQRSIITGF